MPSIKLLSSNAGTLECEPGRTKTDYYDNSSPLILEVRSSGGRTYYVRYRDRYGKTRQQKIAPYNEVTFDEAKRKAKQVRSEALLGGDPLADKAALKAIPTYAELAAQHLAYVKTYQRSYDTTEMYLRVHVLPRWGKTRLTEIRPQGITGWLAEKAETGLAPATVEKIRVIMSRSFSLGSKLGVPGCDRNPVKDVPRRVFQNQRTRFLNSSEVARLLAAAGKSRNRALRSILALLLATGARVSEVLGAKWENVDLERRTLFLPMTKNGRSRHVPLSRAAIEVIEGLQLERRPGAIFLFPSRFDPSKPLGSIKHAWQETCRYALLPGVRIHDLRHSAASAMVAAGVDLYSVGKVLGHVNHASTARYAHLANDRLLAAVDAGSAGLNLG